MAELSSITLELENIRTTKDELNNWIDSTFDTLKDIQSRPGKLRSDAAQLELNQLQDLRNVRIGFVFFSEFVSNIYSTQICIITFLFFSVLRKRNKGKMPLWNWKSENLKL